MAASRPDRGSPWARPGTAPPDRRPVRAPGSRRCCSPPDSRRAGCFAWACEADVAQDLVRSRARRRGARAALARSGCWRRPSGAAAPGAETPSPAAGAIPRLSGRPPHRTAPAVGVEQAVQQAQQQALSRAVRAHDDGQAAARDASDRCRRSGVVPPASIDQSAGLAGRQSPISFARVPCASVCRLAIASGIGVPRAVSRRVMTAAFTAARS